MLLDGELVWWLYGQTQHMQADLLGTFPAARAGFAPGQPVVLDLGGFFCYKMLFLSKALNCVLEVLAKEMGESLGKPFLPSSKQSGLFPALPLGASMPGGAVAPAGQLLAALMGP